MSCDICFAVSHAPCDRLFRLLPTELVTYLASADANVTLCAKDSCRALVIGHAAAGDRRTPLSL
jgi:hypothetical protein